jgi:hypothetical protein
MILPDTNIYRKPDLDVNQVGYFTKRGTRQESRMISHDLRQDAAPKIYRSASFDQRAGS